MQVLAVQIAGIPVSPTANTLRLHNYGTLISEIRTMQAVSAANVPPDPCCAVRRPCHQRFGVATSRHGRGVVRRGAAGARCGGGAVHRGVAWACCIWGVVRRGVQRFGVATSRHGRGVVRRGAAGARCGGGAVHRGVAWACCIWGVVRRGVAGAWCGRSVVCQGAVRYGRVLTVVGCGMQWYPDCVRIVRGITGVRKIRTQRCGAVWARSNSRGVWHAVVSRLRANCTRYHRRA